MGIKEVENKIQEGLRWPPFKTVSSRPVRLPVKQDWNDEENANASIIDEDLIGEVTQFYYRINVAVLSLTEPIRIGDKVNILGYTTDFVQNVTSLQIEHQPVKTAGAGQEVALKVSERVRRGDKVFKLT